MDELLKQRAACKSKIKALDSKIKTLLAVPELSSDQRAEHERLDAEFSSLIEQRKRIDRQIESAKEEAEDDRRQSDLEATEREAQLQRDRSNRRIGGIATRDLPATPVAQDASGWVEVGNRFAAVSQDPRFGGFKSPRHFLTRVMEFGTRGVLDPMLKPRLAAGSDEARGNSDPTGGFLVPEGFSPNFMQLRPEDDPMAKYITRIPMQLPNIKIPARTDKNHTSSVSGGLTVTRRPETVAGTASQMTLERIEMVAHELFGLSYATEEILTDSPISFVAILEAGFSDQFTYQIIKERLNGTGVGEFLGAMNAANPSLVAVAKRTGQAASTIIYENILDIMSRVWGYSSSIWMVNHDTLPQLGLLNQSVGTAGTGMIWQPSAREDTPPLLMGRPVVFSEYMQTLGTQGDIACINWTQYLEGVYQPMQSAESMHVRFVNHERAFKFWIRNAGQPWWKSALTPVNSTATLSPFVTLAVRA